MQFFINALCTLFELIFNNVLSPILTDILTLYVNYYTNILWILFSDLLLGLFIAVCTLVDFIGSIFNVFAGVSPAPKHGPQNAVFTICNMLLLTFALLGILHVCKEEDRPLPFIGGIYAPGRGILPKYTFGRYETEDLAMYVGTGIGNSLIPVRIFNPPEIITVVLKCEE